MPASSFDLVRFCCAISTTSLLSALAAPQGPQHLFRAMKGPKTQEHDPVLVNAIASNLYAWCKSGPYGCLFDGVTNVNLKQAMIHFELSLIKNDKMKALAGFLIMNVCRSEIMNRPRTQRKWVIFEEVARFLNVPGGDEIVKEYYKQMRKYRCRVLTITQEFTDFANSIVKQPIMNNSDQIFLLRLSKGELDLIVEVKPDLPENIQEEVLQYTKPQHQPVGNKYNAFAYYHTGQARPITGTVHNYASPEMIEVAASSYDDFKTRDIKSLLMESTEN